MKLVPLGTLIALFAIGSLGLTVGGFYHSYYGVHAGETWVYRGADPFAKPEIFYVQEVRDGWVKFTMNGRVESTATIRWFKTGAHRLTPEEAKQIP